MGLFDIFTSKEERMRNLYADAIKLCDAGQYAKAAPMLLTVAEYGDPRAQKVYGELLEARKGVARDLPAAIQYYEQAARMGSVAAAVNIGDCWRELAATLSIVKAEDCAKKALAAYAKAAGMEGNPEAGAAARDSLRALYDLPRYQENQAPAVFRKVVSCEQALKWMRKAAEGDPKAAEALPGLEAYIKSGGAQRPPAQAATAAQNDDCRAGLAARRSGDVDKARACLEKAAADGCGAAMAALARLYLDAPGGPDVGRAIRCYEAAVRQGYGPARLPLARLHTFAPFSVYTIRSDGMKLLRALAEEDDPEAQYLYGNGEMLGLGLLNKKDPAWAAQWYRRAAGAGHPGAMEAYAWARYREGEQHRLSDPKAQAACYQDAGKWRLAALKCRPTAGAQYLRGRLLYTGDDTDEEALYWFMCAADAGEAQAMQVVLHMLQGKAGKVAGDRVLYEYWQQKAAAAGMDVAQSPERDAAQTAERDAALPQMPGGQDSQKAGGPTLDTRRADAQKPATPAQGAAPDSFAAAYFRFCREQLQSRQPVLWKDLDPAADPAAAAAAVQQRWEALCQQLCEHMTDWLYDHGGVVQQWPHPACGAALTARLKRGKPAQGVEFGYFGAPLEYDPEQNALVTEDPWLAPRCLSYDALPLPERPLADWDKVAEADKKRQPCLDQFRQPYQAATRGLFENWQKAEDAWEAAVRAGKDAATC